MRRDKGVLPKKAIAEFMKIYKAKLGIELDYKEAERKADSFLNLFALITNNSQLNVKNCKNE